MTTVDTNNDAGRPENEAAEVEVDEAEIWADLDEEDVSTDEPLDAPDVSGADEEDEQFTDTEDDEPNNEPADDEPAGQQAADDPFANATPEQRAAWDAAQAQIAKLEQSDRSQRGRLGAMQRQVNEMMAKATASEAPAPQAGQPEPAPEGSYLESDDYKTFVEEYPEVASPMSKIIGNLEKRLANAEQRLSADEQAEVNSAIDEQTELLTESYPDWQEVLAADDEAFMEWLPSQPRHVQEAAYRNANEIVDAEEAADVFSRFQAFRSANGAGNPSDTPANSGSGKPRLTGRRQRQLESATGARGKGPGVVSGIPEDGDEGAIWDAFDKLEQREAQRA